MAYTSTSNGRGAEVTYVEQVFTATATATIKSGLIIANSATAITITLPTPDFGGYHWRFINVNVGVATLTLPAGITWDGTNVSKALAAGATIDAWTVSADRVLFTEIGGYELAATNGAIALTSGTVYLTKAGVAAMTLAAPTATIDDGKTLRFVATTANAHTVTQTTPGFNNASTSKDVATFGGAIGDNFQVIAYQGVWHVLTTTNVTIA